MRDLIPPELQQRLAEALREVLQALRDLLDWYLERLSGDGPSRGGRGHPDPNGHAAALQSGRGPTWILTAHLELRGPREPTDSN